MTGNFLRKILQVISFSKKVMKSFEPLRNIDIKYVHIKIVRILVRNIFIVIIGNNKNYN